MARHNTHPDAGRRYPGQKTGQSNQPTGKPDQTNQSTGKGDSKK